MSIALVGRRRIRVVDHEAGALVGLLLALVGVTALPGSDADPRVVVA